VLIRWLLLAVLLVPGSARAEDWTDCLRRAAPQHDASALLTLTHVDRVGDARESRAWLRWVRREGGSSLRIEVTEPEDLRGTVITLEEEAGEIAEVWVDLPELEGARRLSGRRLRMPLLGSDLTLEDLRRLSQVIQSRQRSSIEGIPVGGRSTWRVALRPEPGTDSPYDSVVSYVDRDTCVPLRTEMSRSERIRKVVGVDHAWIEALGDGFVARRWQIEDLSDGSRTRVSLDQLHVDSERGGARTAQALPGPE
jgi:hypothetical protein